MFRVVKIGEKKNRYYITPQEDVVIRKVVTKFNDI